jgi:transcriptional regulator with XRE-family HTH domain
MTPSELRERRLALCLSQRLLAESLGVNKSTVSHWETGVQGIPPYVDLALMAIERDMHRQSSPWTVWRGKNGVQR